MQFDLVFKQPSSRTYSLNKFTWAYLKSSTIMQLTLPMFENTPNSLPGFVNWQCVVSRLFQWSIRFVLRKHSDGKFLTELLVNYRGLAYPPSGCFFIFPLLSWQWHYAKEKTYAIFIFTITSLPTVNQMGTSRCGHVNFLQCKRNRVRLDHKIPVGQHTDHVAAWNKGIRQTNNAERGFSCKASSF